MKTKFSVVLKICSVPVISIMVGILISVLDKKVCLSDKCKRMSLMIQERIDSGVDPCEDFYQFSCGRLLSKNDTTGLRFSLTLEAARRVNLKLLTILENPEMEKEPKSFRKVKSFFRTCQEKESTNTQTENLLKLVKEWGGFPTLESDKWNESEWSFMDTIRKLRKSGIQSSSLFTLGMGNNPYQLNQLTLVSHNPTLTFPPELLVLCDSFCNATYTQLFTDYVIKLGADKNRAHNDAIEILALEIQLAASVVKTPSHFEYYQLKNRSRTLANFIASYDFIDWLEFINILYNTSVIHPETAVIIVTNPDYIGDLKSILNSTPKRVLANYMMWSILHNLKYTPGSQMGKAECFEFIHDELSIVLQGMYLAKYSDSSYKQTVTDTILNLKKQLALSIQAAEWMSSESKKEAVDKVMKIYPKIGYPEELVNVTYVDNYYDKLYLSSNLSLLSSMLIIKKFNLDKISSQLFTTIENAAWNLDILSLSVLDPNAFYYILDNSITIPHGILQEPVYESDLPEYVAYGRLGTIIGHEITHSLDTSGCHYDGNGQIRDWWDRFSFLSFQNKTKCFIEQFGEFKFFNGVQEAYLPAELEVAENIADAGGVNLAFLAYQEYSKGRIWPELAIPWLQYSNNQLFFISFAHFYCWKYAPKDYLTVSTDSHAPMPWRVIGSLQNTKYFSESFGCKPGSRMNPNKKCELW